MIAQSPAERRDSSRMMVVNRSRRFISDGYFLDLPDLLTSDDILVLNNTKVFPARLNGKTDTGSNVEVFLVNDLGEDEWEVLARPGKRLSVGKKIDFDGELTAISLGKLPDGLVLLKFLPVRDFFSIVEKIGRTPLPPYIKREGVQDEADRARYQTVYASKRGAIAAPTAGLHFTPDVLERLRDKGVNIASITLHVGYGTFAPVRVEDLKQHSVLPERYEIDRQTSDLLNAAKAEGRRFVAVGTTTTRALESSLRQHRRFVPGKHLADLTITPGYEFRAIDALLTNFHLPRSSLLILTSTFGGLELIMDAYRHAVEEKYRFYSYGDCMLIV